MKTLPPLDVRYPIADAERATLLEQGQVTLRGVFSAEELAAYTSEIDAYVMAGRERLSEEERRMGASPKRVVFSVSDAPESVVRFVTAPRLGAIAADLLHVPAVRILQFTGFFKPGGAPQLPWHQDASYVPISTDKMLTVWVPLVDVTPEMGSLWFVKGSHRWGPRDPRTAERHPPLKLGLLAAGDASVHLGWTLHCSGPNTTERMRAALAMLFYADGTKLWCDGRFPLANVFMQRFFPELAVGDVAAGPNNPIVFQAQ